MDKRKYVLVYNQLLALQNWSLGEDPTLEASEPHTVSHPFLQYRKSA